MFASRGCLVQLWLSGSTVAVVSPACVMLAYPLLLCFSSSVNLSLF